MLKGVLIKESLEDESVLGEIIITDTSIEKVSNVVEGQPDNWTLISFEVDDQKAFDIAKRLSRSLKLGTWYVHFYNDSWVWVAFPDRVFYYQKGDATGKEVVLLHAKALGIPESQLDW